LACGIIYGIPAGVKELGYHRGATDGTLLFKVDDSWDSLNFKINIK